MKKYLVHVIWLVVAIVAFVGGMYYGKSTGTAAFAGRSGAFASSTRAGGLAGRGSVAGGFVSGTVVSEDAQSLTIQLPNGNSQIVFYSTSTSVIKPTPASVSDLTAGTSVMIGGTQNSDGSLTAQSIQVRPAGTPGFGGPGGGRGGNATSSQ